MKLLILVLGLVAPFSGYAESCSGSITMGPLEVNGTCENGFCSVRWDGFIESGLRCGSVTATVTGSLNGMGNGTCSGRFATIPIGGSFEVQGSCSDGKHFSGQAVISETAAAASCQPTGSIFASTTDGLAEVTGNCL